MRLQNSVRQNRLELICEATRAFLLDAGYRDRGHRRRYRVLLRCIGCRVHGDPSNAWHAEFHAEREPVWRLAGTFSRRSRPFWVRALARKQKIGADLFVDAHRARDRGPGRPSDQGHDWPGAPVGESRAYVERSASERFEIPLLSVGSCRCVCGILRGAIVGQAPHRLGLPADPNTHWLFAVVPRSSLFVGRRLRSVSWNRRRSSRLAFSLSKDLERGSSVR